MITRCIFINIKKVGINHINVELSSLKGINHYFSAFIFVIYLFMRFYDVKIFMKNIGKHIVCLRKMNKIFKADLVCSEID